MQIALGDEDFLVITEKNKNADWSDKIKYSMFLLKNPYHLLIL